MPRGDGTGPRGQGPRTGRGLGRGGGFGAAPGGYCICPDCGERVPHQVGIACYEQRCPKCGTALTWE